MTKIKTEIIINAPANQIWETLMSFEKHNNWNPLISKISGDAIAGKVLDVIIQLPGQSPMNFKPTVLNAEKNKEFRWRGKLFVKGLFDGEHYFTLEPINENTTIFHHGETFSGLLAGILFRMIGKSTEQGFNNMNQALKKEIEG